MTRHRWFLFLALPIAVVLTVGLWYFWPRKSTSITPETAASIQPGMTVEDLEILFKCPPGNYSTGPIEMDGPFRAPKEIPRHDFVQWTSDKASVTVWLDAQGRVEDVETVRVRRSDLTVGDHIRGWLGL